MASNPISLNGALAILNALEGQHVWAPECLLDEILSLQFGAPRLVVHKPLRMPAGPSIENTRGLSRYAGARGRWTLYVEGGDWTVSANGYESGRSDPATTNDTRCLHALRGQVLIGTTWDARNLEWRFSFDLGGTVIVRAPNPEEDPPADYEWHLFRDGEQGLTCLRDDRLELGDDGS